MLNGGRWEVNGTVTQLLDPAWVAATSKASPSDWTPCPYYSHFFWRKPLNSGRIIGRADRPVPDDTFYAWGGGGQFAVVVPSLDMVVVSLYGASPTLFVPPSDIQSYDGKQYFPSASESERLAALQRASSHLHYVVRTSRYARARGCSTTT